jgi:hypothetical protein
MKIYKKKSWEKPIVSDLSIKNLTLGGSKLSTQENTNGANDKRPS